MVTEILIRQVCSRRFVLFDRPSKCSQHLTQFGNDTVDRTRALFDGVFGAMKIEQPDMP